jgi:hypothetical protein
LVDEVARAVTRQMIEQLHANVAADGDEGMRGRPAGDAPQNAVAGYQPQQNRDGAPQHRRRRLMSAEHVDQVLYRVLGSHVAQYGCEHRGDHDEMAEKPPAHVASQKAKDPFVRVAWRWHDGICVPSRLGLRGSALFLVNSSPLRAGQRKRTSVSIR